MNLFSRLHHLLHLFRCLRRLFFAFRGEFGYLDRQRLLLVHLQRCPGLGLFHSFWGLADYDQVDRQHARKFPYSLVAEFKGVDHEDRLLRRLGLYVSHSWSLPAFVSARERGFL